jgi:hypothetical protein
MPGDERLTTEQERDALRKLLGGAFTIQLNMNDTFAFACSDSEEMDLDDVEELLPLIHRYGRHALTAYVAVKRSKVEDCDVQPISCTCCHDGEEYRAARAEIERLYEETGEHGLLGDTKWLLRQKEERDG